MDGLIRYCVVKKYSGVFKKTHKNNVHLLFVPVEPKKIMYLAIVGQLTDDEDAYAAKLLVKIPEQTIDKIIEGEHEFFGDRFVEVETLKCRSSNQAPGKYVIHIPKKGFNILSDLEIQYHVEYSTVSSRIYVIRGDLNLVTGEVSQQDMNMVAAKQTAFLGKPQRFSEMEIL